MKSLIRFTLLLSVASMAMGADMFNFGGMVKQATDAVKQGMDMGMQGVKQGMDMGKQTMNMGMQVFNQAMSSPPFMEVTQAAQKMLETASETSTGYANTMMEMFQKGADDAAKMAEGSAGMAEGAVVQTQQLFNQGLQQLQVLQSSGAPKADYMDLLKKMQGPMNRRR